MVQWAAGQRRTLDPWLEPEKVMNSGAVGRAGVWGQCMLEGCQGGMNAEWQTLTNDAFSCCAVLPVRDLEVLTRKEKMLEKGHGHGRGLTCHSPQAPVSGMNMAWGLPRA